MSRAPRSAEIPLSTHALGQGESPGGSRSWSCHGWISIQFSSSQLSLAHSFRPGVRTALGLLAVLGRVEALGGLEEVADGDAFSTLRRIPGVPGEGAGAELVAQFDGLAFGLGEG